VSILYYFMLISSTESLDAVDKPWMPSLERNVLLYIRRCCWPALCFT